MIQVSQTTKNLVSAYERELYGETMQEVKAKADAKANAKANAKAKAEAKAEAEAKKELKKMDDKLKRTIPLLHTKVGMTIEEIAAHLEISIELITETLAQNKS